MFTLEIVDGPATGLRANLGAGQKLTVGRLEENDVVVSRDLTVSRRHFQLICGRSGDTCTVLDWESSHGTWLNDDRLERMVPRPIEQGDVVRAGHSVFRVVKLGGPPRKKVAPDAAASDRGLSSPPPPAPEPPPARSAPVRSAPVPAAPVQSSPPAPEPSPAPAPRPAAPAPAAVPEPVAEQPAAPPTIPPERGIPAAAPPAAAREEIADPDDTVLQGRKPDGADDDESDAGEFAPPAPAESPAPPPSRVSEPPTMEIAAASGPTMEIDAAPAADAGFDAGGETGEIPAGLADLPFRDESVADSLGRAGLKTASAGESHAATLAALRDDTPDDALKFLAAALPPADAVRWAVRCVRAAAGDGPSRGDAAALDAAGRWADDPTEANRRACESTAGSAASGGAAANCAAAAFFSGDTIGPAGGPTLPPPPGMAAKTLHRALRKAADTHPDAAGEGCERFFALASDAT